MKKSVFRMLFTAFLGMGPVVAQAQIDLGGVLKNAAGQVSGAARSKSSGSANGGMLSGLTSIFSASKVAKAKDLVGTWTYQEPAIVFSSSSALKNAGGKMAGAVIEKQLQSKLSAMGIKPGMFTMTFKNDGTFTQSGLGKQLGGTYTVTGNTVNLAYGGQVKQVVGTTQVEGGSLLIVMNTTKLLDYMKTIGALSGNATLKSASSLIGSMDGMQCGLRLKK